jgi:hypothetical protein
LRKKRNEDSMDAGHFDFVVSSATFQGWKFVGTTAPGSASAAQPGANFRNPFGILFGANPRHRSATVLKASRSNVISPTIQVFRKCFMSD